jgi:FKBP-type peptidyl-prolyl cis-trans isomerase FkpA
MRNKSNSRWSAVTLAVPLLVLSCRAPEAPKPNLELKTEEEQVLYGLGLDIGRSISVFSLQPHELELVKLGLTDAVTQIPPKVDLDTMRPKLMELARKRSQASSEVEKQKGKTAVEKAAKEPGAEQLASGVVIKSLRPGTGASPIQTDAVKVHYEGRLLDGTVFDSSYKRNEPASFSLQGVVPCWTEGLQKMKVGEKAQLTCPSEAAYGEQGHPPTIPGGATLVFDVELLEVNGK